MQIYLWFNGRKAHLKKAWKHPLVYFRFIDSIFNIWTHSGIDFLDFFEVLHTHS